MLYISGEARMACFDGKAIKFYGEENKMKEEVTNL